MSFAEVNSNGLLPSAGRLMRIPIHYSHQRKKKE